MSSRRTGAGRRRERPSVETSTPLSASSAPHAPGHAVGAEVDGPDVGNHHGTQRIRETPASSGHHEHRAVDELPAQLGDPCLPLLLTLFFGRAELAPPYRAAAAAASAAGCIASARINSAAGSSLARTCRVQPGDAASSRRPYAGPDAYANVRTKLSPSSRRPGDRARPRSRRPRMAREARAGVRGEAFVDVEGALGFDFVRISRVTSLAEGQRLANGQRARLSRFPQRPCERAPFEPHPIPSIHGIQMFSRDCPYA